MERIAARTQTAIADTLIAALAFVAAYLLSPSKLPDLGFDGQFGSLNIAQLACLYAALAAAFGFMSRRQLSPWRYVSVPDILVLGRVVVLTAVVFLLFAFFVDRAKTLPRSALLMAAFLHFGGLAAARLFRRAAHERALGSLAGFAPSKPAPAHAAPVLLVGKVAAAEAYLRDANRRSDREFSPVGIVCPDERDLGLQVRGVCMIGSFATMESALEDLRRWNRYPRAILLLEDPARLRGLSMDLLGRLRSEGVRLLRLPSLVELAQPDGPPVREVTVEELLPRDPIELDREMMERLIGGRRVLVTGAGGSIGSELCRQVAALGCEHLTLIDQSETALFEIDRELAETRRGVSRRAILCDVRDGELLNCHFEAERPALIFHAAALKHVGVVERHPCEGVLTNVIGAWNVAQAARGCGAGQVVLISTDKAVDPTSVMGATKRLAEAVVQASQSANGPRFAGVRFGNVLGSAGSVVPIFKSQIERGGPVTVTHEEMARFFMTISEAAQLVLHATAASMDAEAGGSPIYVLEMGKPVKILDLAHQMIALSGRTPGEDIAIEITGLRPGEKLTERLLDVGERAAPCAPKVFAVEAEARGRIDENDIAMLRALALDGEAAEMRRAVFDLVERIRKPRAPKPDLRVVAGG